MAEPKSKLSPAPPCGPSPDLKQMDKNFNEPKQMDVGANTPKSDKDEDC